MAKKLAGSLFKPRSGRNVLDELRDEGMQAPGFREGYEARDALIRLGDMLRGLREAEGLTQEELAERTGMAQPTISRLESGFGPRGPEMDTIARFVHGCNAKLVVEAERGPTEASEDEEQAVAAGAQFEEFKTVM
jgi:DNA-binding XRE family transcriptional regulator